MKIAVITDTGSALLPGLYEDLPLYVLPLQIGYKDKTYNEGEDIDIEKMYKIIANGEFPTTASPNLYKIERLFEELKEKGYDHAIAIMLTSGISGTAQILQAQADQFDFPLTNIDCFSTCGVQKGLAIQAAQMVKEHESLEAILSLLKREIQTNITYIVPDDMNHLKRGGRITPMAASLANLLKIRPILMIGQSTNGVIDVSKKVRTQKMAIKQAIDSLNIKNQGRLYILQSNQLEDALRIQKELSSMYPHLDIYVERLSAVIAIHTGMHCLAIQYLPDFKG